MEEQIYKIIRIDEDDFGCEGRPEGQEPMVRVVLEADTGETMIVMMEDALMYTRKLDVGGLAIVGADGLLYAPGAVLSGLPVFSVVPQRRFPLQAGPLSPIMEKKAREAARHSD